MRSGIRAAGSENFQQQGMEVKNWRRNKFRNGIGAENGVPCCFLRPVQSNIFIISLLFAERKLLIPLKGYSKRKFHLLLVELTDRSLRCEAQQYIRR